MRRKNTSFVASAAIAVLCALLIVSQTRHSMAAPDETFGLGTAASLGASPPDGQSVSGGDAKVASRTGAYEYQYPISVVPGRLGMQPTLSLDYSSQGQAYGTVASHWDLRIPELRVDYSEGRLRTLLAASEMPWKSDLAGGHRLVPVTVLANSVAAGRKAFRAEVDDSFARYEKFSDTSGAGPLWLARTTEGRVLYFGDANNISTNDGSPSFLVDRAPLTREEDKFGNAIDYYWSTNGETPTGDDVWDAATSYRIDRIEYTKNTTVASGAHFAEVRFNYGDPMYCGNSELPVGARSDHHGDTLRIEGAYPLNSISTHVADSSEHAGSMREVRRVNLGYDRKNLCRSNSSPIRQLTSISEVGIDATGNEVESNPITFRYGLTEAVFSKHATFNASGPSAGTTKYPNAVTWGKRTRNPSVESQLIDLDGDGRLDRVFTDFAPTSAYDGAAANTEDSSMNGCGMVWLRNEGDGFATDEPGTSDSVVAVKLPSIGWNGGASQPGTSEYCSLSGQLSTKTNTTYAAEASCVGSVTTNLAYRFMDMNSDGRPDLVTGLHYNRTLYDPELDGTIEYASMAYDPSDTEVSHPGGEVYNHFTASSKYLLDCGTNEKDYCRFNVDMIGLLKARFAAAVMGDPSAEETYKLAIIGDDDGGGTGGGNCRVFEPNCECFNPAECCEASTQPCCGGPPAWGDQSECDGDIGGGGDTGGGDTGGGDTGGGDTGGGDTDWVPDDDRRYPDDPDGPPEGLSCPIDMVPQKVGSRFALRWYRNEGPENGFFNLDNPRLSLSPISLDPNTGESESQDIKVGHRIQHGPSRFIDINGDGHLDAVWSDGRNNTTISTGDAPLRNVVIWSVHLGDGFGGFHRDVNENIPYPWIIPDGAQLSTQLLSVADYHQGNNEELQIRTLAGSELVDMNADGLVDLVYWHNENRKKLSTDFGSARIYLNTGHGFLRSYSPVGSPSLSVAEPGYTTASNVSGFGEDLAIEFGRIESATGESLIRLSDFDSDGRPDLLVRHLLEDPYQSSPLNYDHTIAGRLYVNPGMGTLLTPSTSSSIATAPGFMAHKSNVTSTEWMVTHDFVDLDGDGQQENVSMSGNWLFSMESRDVGDTPLRLLNQVDNGRGGIVDISYAPQNDPRVATSSQVGNAVMPSHLWVVKDVKRTETASAQTSLTEARYGDPVWNKDQRGNYGFRGFESIETSALRDEAATTGFSVTKQTYGYDVDTTGRVVETSVFVDGFPAADGSSAVASVSKTTLVEIDDVMGGVTRSYTPVAVRGWNCAQADGSFLAYNDCTGAGQLPTTEQRLWPTSYRPHGETTGPYVLSLSADDWQSATGNSESIYRRRTYRVYSTESFYRIAQAEESVHAGAAGPADATTQNRIAQQSFVSVNDGLYESETTVYVDASNSKTSKTELNTTLGHVVFEENPEHYETGIGISYNYEGFEVSASSVTPPRASPAPDAPYMTSTFETDLGTGLVIQTESANIVSCGGSTGPEGGRSTFDGFGRPIDTYRFGCLDASTYGAYQTSHIDYTEFSDTGPASVRSTMFLDIAGTQAVISETYYDGFGRAVRTRQDLSSEDSNVLYEYGANGKLARVRAPNPQHDSDSLKAEVTYRYDTLGRLIGTRVPDSSGSGVAPDPDLLNTSWNSYVGTDFVYGFQSGLSTKHAAEHVLDDGPQAQTTTHTDSRGQLVLVKEATSTGLATTNYYYDGLGNLENIMDADGIKTAMAHDWASRRTSITRGNRTWTFEYDDNDNLLFETTPVPPGGDAALYRTMHTYDDLDRVTSVVRGERDLDSSLFGTTTVHTYDEGHNGLGRLSSTTGPFHEKSFSYDDAGRVAKEALEFDLTQHFSGLKHSFKRTTRYNAAGMPTRVTTPEGRVVDYTYDSAGRPAGLGSGNDLKVLFGRNVAGLVVQQESGCISREWEYDHLGRTTQTDVFKNANCSGQTTGQGLICEGKKQLQPLTESMSYYDSNDVSELVVERPCLDDRSFKFAYDDQHQLEYAVDDIGEYEANFGFTGAGRVTQAYVKDIIGAPQVIGRDVEYEYGDHEDVDGHAVRRLYDPSYKASSPQYAVVAYTHDSAGNVTTRTEGSNLTSFDYDGLDQQRQATKKFGNSETYYYEDIGSRYLAIERDPVGRVVRSRVWFGGMEYWFDEVGRITNTMTHLSLGSAPVARIATSAKTDEDEEEYSFHNGLGHLMASVGHDGEMDTGFIYGPFGDIVQEYGDVDTHNRRFNGKEADQLSKLNYYGYRYYDPLSLTWTQADPLYRVAPDLAYDQPRLMSLYAFSLNNPVRYMDPDGRSPYGIYGSNGARAGATAPYQSDRLAASIMFPDKVIVQPTTQTFGDVANAVGERLGRALTNAFDGCTQPANAPGPETETEKRKSEAVIIGNMAVAIINPVGTVTGQVVEDVAEDIGGETAAHVAAILQALNGKATAARGLLSGAAKAGPKVGAATVDIGVHTVEVAESAETSRSKAPNEPEPLSESLSCGTVESEKQR